MHKTSKPSKLNLLPTGLRGRLGVALMLLTLPGCAALSPSTPRPVVVEPVRLTPLPTSVQQIDSMSSQDYLQRVETWLRKVEASLKDETAK